MNETKFEKIVVIKLVDLNGTSRITLTCRTNENKISFHGISGKYQGVDITFNSHISSSPMTGLSPKKANPNVTYYY